MSVDECLLRNCIDGVKAIYLGLFPLSWRLRIIDNSKLLLFAYSKSKLEAACDEIMSKRLLSSLKLLYLAGTHIVVIVVRADVNSACLYE